MSSPKRSWYCAKSSAAATPSLLCETATDARQREPPWGQAAGEPADSAVCGCACMVSEQSGKTMRWKLLYRTSDSLRKKWTFGLPRQRAASRRHVFEAYINWFALILQVHRTQSFNNLGEEVAIRYR